MVDSGCCSGTLVRHRMIDPVRALRFFYSMFWDSVLCIRSIAMHCFWQVLVLPDGFFGRSGVFLHAVAAAFSLPLLFAAILPPAVAGAAILLSFFRLDCSGLSPSTIVLCFLHVDILFDIRNCAVVYTTD